MESFFAINTLGLDIQPNQIRLIALRKIKRHFYLEQIEARELESGVFVDDKIEHWDKLTIILSDLVESLKIKGRSVAIQLPFHLVKAQTLQLPFGLTDEQIRSEIHLNIRNEWPDINSFDMDYYSLASDGSEIMYVTISRDYLTRYIECIHKIGLQVKIVDIDIYALMRATHAAINIFSNEIKTNRSILIYLTTLQLNVAVWNGLEVVAYQHWKIDFLKEDWMQLSQNVLLFLTTSSYLHLQKLFVGGDYFFASTFLQDMSHELGLPIHYLDVLSLIKPKANKINPDSSFSLACSLAMREDFLC